MEEVLAQSAGLHEAAANLDAATLDCHLGVVSSQEELEATDWYDL